MGKPEDDTPMEGVPTEDIAAAVRLAGRSKDVLQAALHRRRLLGHHTRTGDNGVERQTDRLGQFAAFMSSWQAIGGAVLAAFIGAVALFSWVVYKVATKDDVKVIVVDGIKEHASHPHPLSDDEKATLAAEKRAHEDEVSKRGEMNGKLDILIKQNEWWNTAAYQSPRLNLPASNPPPKPPAKTKTASKETP